MGTRSPSSSPTSSRSTPGSSGRSSKRPASGSVRRGSEHLVPEQRTARLGSEKPVVGEREAEGEAQERGPGVPRARIEGERSALEQSLDVERDHAASSPTRNSSVQNS